MHGLQVLRVELGMAGGRQVEVEAHGSWLLHLTKCIRIVDAYVVYDLRSYGTATREMLMILMGSLTRK